MCHESRRVLLYVGINLVISVSCCVGSEGILGDASRKPEEIAARVLDDMLVEIQSDTRFATCYVGSFVNEGRAKPNANGLFEFVGFYARSPGQEGGRQIRVWSANDATVNGQFQSLFYTNDRLFSGKQWSYTKCGGSVKDVDPAEKNGEYRFRGLCLDSRLAMIQFAYGINAGKARGLCEKHYFMSANLISAKRLADGNVLAIVQGPGHVRFHCTLDKRYEFRPSKVVVTKENSELAEGDANAIVINEVRWAKQDDDERWIADAGSNTQYGGGTKANAPRAISYNWKSAWWHGKDVPAEFFEKSKMTSNAGTLFDEFSKFIEKASAVPSLDEVGDGGKRVKFR